jgi:hypothetical protein
MFKRSLGHIDPTSRFAQHDPHSVLELAVAFYCPVDLSDFDTTQPFHRVTVCKRNFSCRFVAQ